jgi:uncharacterized protein
VPDRAGETVSSGAILARSILSAGGTLASPPASARLRAWLALEMVLIFGLAPIAMWQVIHGDLFEALVGPFLTGGRIGLFAALIPVLGGVILLLLADRSFSLRRELSRGIPWRAMVLILAVFAVLGGGVALYMWSAQPGLFFEFPRRRPEVYARIIVLYPLISVLAQEIVYRTFFFHRYGRLFGRRIWLAIALNGLAFGYAHIVMGNAFAVWSTVLTGLLFAHTYVTTRSLWAVWLEHSLWGALVFTVGLGGWFFTGVGN